MSRLSSVDALRGVAALGVVLLFGFSQLATALLITTPTCVAFAWVFFWFAERPYLNAQTTRREDPRAAPDAIATLEA